MYLNLQFKETYRYINPKDYIEIFLMPDWYLQLQPQLQEYFYNYDGDKKRKSQRWLETRGEFVKMASELLESNQIALGNSGSNWDEKRKAIKNIVIHHSSTPSNTPLQTINALGLIRLYAPVYSKKNTKQFGRPLWSNHFYNGKPTFIAYHYIIEQDGTIHHILNDEQIGWHAGDWNINCNSIAICFLDELEEKKPTIKAIQSARKIIAKYPDCKLLGHREVSKKTTCPGKLFLGEKGWKSLLLPQNRRQIIDNSN